VGIAAALAFQIIFFSVWLTAYDGVFERTDQLKVALVTEDARFGEVVSKAIEEKVPFDSVRVDDLDKAKTEMDERKWTIVIYISDRSEERRVGKEGSFMRSKGHESGTH